ncbi:MAG: dihydropteroate synthase [Chloroflexi bacterium]|nr:dihydropteroate synthase [Chloroflexota bacterium]
MQTILRSDTVEVKINTEGPVVIIGEKINPTGRKKLAAALQEGNFGYIQDLAAKQVVAGADVLDVNVGVPGLDEVMLLPQVVKAVVSQVNVPICLDSANPAALAAALAVTPGKPLVNSVNGEETSLRAVLPIVKDRGAAVIGLTMDEKGIPNDPESRLAIAGKILERAARIGIPTEDVVIDPLVLTVGADSNAGVVTLRTIELVRREFGVNINLGASNVSFGLPDRHTINQALLALAVGAGASCVITDPIKLTGTVRAIDLLLGRDLYARRYITHFRSRPKEND